MIQGADLPSTAAVLPGVSPSRQVAGDVGGQVNSPKVEKSPPTETKAEQLQGTQEKVNQAVDQLNTALDTFNIELRFVVDHSSGDTVVYMVDTAKKEIIRRVPPEHVVNAAGRLQEMLGLFINKLI